MENNEKNMWQPIFNKKKNSIKYIPKAGDEGRSSQADTIEEINLIGFSKLPAGFYKDGWGLTKPASTYLLPYIRDTFKNKKIILNFKENQHFKIEKKSKVVKISFDYLKYKTMLSELQAMKTAGNKRIKSRLSDHLAKWFPNTFENLVLSESLPDYSSGDLARYLEGGDKIIKLLSDKDKEHLSDFYIKYFEEEAKIDPRVFDKKIGSVKLSKNVTQNLYVQPVIKKFEAQLKKKKQEESWWQTFFKSHLLDFNTNYNRLIEKQNIDLSVQLPDFLAIDNYNYIDVIEIKRPDTKLLLEDKSHKNFYWSADVAKAISQTENYIHSLSRSSDRLSIYLRDKENVDIKAIRPKGIIIVGANEELKDKKKLENFRILNDSLKNITIITFNDVLGNLKSLLSKIKPNKKSRRRKK